MLRHFPKRHQRDYACASFAETFSISSRSEQIAHPVAFHEQGAFQRAGRYGLEIIGAVKPGGAVIIGRADLLQVGEIIGRQIFRTVEHQMLEQMGEPGLAFGFVLRPDIVPGADRDDRGLAIFMDDDRQAIVELEGLMRDNDLADQRG